MDEQCFEKHDPFTRINTFVSNADSRGAIMKKEVVELRKKMAENGIDVYYVPSGDFHSSEYVNDYFKAREFMSGLTGESGELIVDDEGAYLWTDGRYFLQAETQLAGSDIQLMRMAEPGVPTVDEFLIDLAKKKPGFVLGFDGRVLPSASGKAIEDELTEMDVTIKSDKDLVGEIWTNRPAIQPSKIWVFPDENAGRTADQKLADIRKEMAEKDADYLLLTDLMETAWTLNLRGGDIDYTPVFFSFLLIGKEKDDVRLFVMDGAMDDLPGKKLPKNLSYVKVEPYENIYEAVGQLPEDSKLWLDPWSANFTLVNSVSGNVDIIEDATPVAMMKAVKNETEIRSTIGAHIKDACAMVKFIKWVKDAVKKQPLTEIKAADYLEACRREQGAFDLSFETISGYNENGAIIHYAPTPETDKALAPEGFLLVDSGGQYMDGTTDITRTIALGEITQEMKDTYTYVLKSHIAMATAKLTPDMNGINLDSITRQPLRHVGMDFKHGLSHGIGHVLGVHEGPNILRRVPTPIEIKAGMVMSDEPGLYLDHKFGVRIENEVLFEEDENGYLVNEPITFVPYERKAINPDLLTAEEVAWLNAYNQLVRDTILDKLDEELADFVKIETEPIQK